MSKQKKSLWDKLFKRPILLSPSIDAGKCLHVIHIEKDTNSVIESLGISKERADELLQITYDSYTKHNSIVSVCEDVSKYCKHANELFFVSIAIVNKQRDIIELMSIRQKY
jgi:hypothetical protein